MPQGNRDAAPLTTGWRAASGGGGRPMMTSTLRKARPNGPGGASPYRYITKAANRWLCRIAHPLPLIYGRHMHVHCCLSK